MPCGRWSQQISWIKSPAHHNIRSVLHSYNNHLIHWTHSKVIILHREENLRIAGYCQAVLVLYERTGWLLCQLNDFKTWHLSVHYVISQVLCRLDTFINSITINTIVLLRYIVKQVNVIKIIRNRGCTGKPTFEFHRIHLVFTHY